LRYGLIKLWKGGSLPWHSDEKGKNEQRWGNDARQLRGVVTDATVFDTRPQGDVAEKREWGKERI